MYGNIAFEQLQGLQLPPGFTPPFRPVVKLFSTELSFGQRVPPCGTMAREIGQARVRLPYCAVNIKRIYKPKAHIPVEKMYVLLGF